MQGGSGPEETSQYLARQCPPGHNAETRKHSDQNKDNTKDITIEPTSIDISNQELPTDLMGESRKLRQQKAEEGKHKGWVFDALRGHCCDCETNSGFTRELNRCRQCAHIFCTFCTSLEAT